MSKKVVSVCTFAVALLLSGAAFAQNDDHDRDRDHGRDNRNGYGNYGAEQGYRDGIQHGRDDRSRRAGYNYKSGDYQRGERGYEKYMGSKGQYKQRYRDAYRQGYEAGFNARGGSGGIYGGGRNPNYPNNGDRDHDGVPDWRDSDHGNGGDGDRDHDGVPDSRDRDHGNGSWGNGGIFGGGTEVARIASDYGYQDGVYYAQRDRSAGRSSNPTNCKGYKDADHGYNSRYNRDEFKQAYRQAFLRGYNREFGQVYGRR
jgi:hypothetical protein